MKSEIFGFMLICFSDKVFEVYMAQKKKWQRINWRDPFVPEEQLAGDQKMVRDSAKQYAHDRLQPRVKDAFRYEDSDKNIFREMVNLNF